MIKKLKKQHEKEQTLWKIWHNFERFENTITVEKIHETRHFNDNAI
jgi:hypothetical protein